MDLSGAVQPLFSTYVRSWENHATAILDDENRETAAITDTSIDTSNRSAKPAYGTLQASYGELRTLLIQERRTVAVDLLDRHYTSGGGADGLSLLGELMADLNVTQPAD